MRIHPLSSCQQTFAEKCQRAVPLCRLSVMKCTELMVLEQITIQRYHHRVWKSFISICIQDDAFTTKTSIVCFTVIIQRQKHESILDVCNIDGNYLLAIRQTYWLISDLAACLGPAVPFGSVIITSVHRILLFFHRWPRIPVALHETDYIIFPDISCGCNIPKPNELWLNILWSVKCNICVSISISKITNEKKNID